MKWSTSNKKWFEDKGYEYTKIGDYFLISAKDLKPTSRIDITAICDYCGEQYTTSYASYYTSINNEDVNKCACRNCAGKKNSEVRLLRESRDVFIKLFNACNDLGYQLKTNIAEYTGVKMPVKIICPRHGEKEMILDNILHGHICIDCSYEYRADLLRHNTKKVISDIESINGNKLLNPEEYITSSTSNLRIKCGCCGQNIFNVSYSNYMLHNINKCKSCSRSLSKGEANIQGILDSYGISYVAEKRFQECRDTKTLPFDFYLTDYNALIEFDGEQHFFPVFGEESFRRTRRHDRIKNQFCKHNNIPLLRIPYWERDNEEGHLLKFLDTLTLKYR